jgi:hypothetical protein
MAAPGLPGAAARSATDPGDCRAARACRQGGRSPEDCCARRGTPGRQPGRQPTADGPSPRVRRAGRRYNGGADVTCRRRRDGASWLAWMSIRSGRYVPSSENSPGQPVALECPQRPRGGVRPAAEFVRQFCFRRQLGPRRVLAAPDPPREHGVNVLVGPRVLPRIIHDQPHGQCKRLQPLLIARAPPGTPARGRTYGWFTRG